MPNKKIKLLNDITYDAPQVYSFMIYPDCESKRAEYLQHLKAQAQYNHFIRQGTTDFVTLPRKVIEQNQRAQTYFHATFNERKKITILGLTAGTILKHWARNNIAKSKIGKVASITSAKDITVARADPALGINKEKVDIAWRDFKMIAHFWACESILRHHLDDAKTLLSPDTLGQFLMFLGYAKGFYNYCDTVKAARQTKKTKLWDKDEAIWFQDDSNIPTNIFEVETNIIESSLTFDDEIMKLLTETKGAYKNKKTFGKSKTT